MPMFAGIPLLLPRPGFRPKALGGFAAGATGSGLAEGVTALGQLIPGSMSSSPFCGEGGVLAQDGAECKIDLPGSWGESGSNTFASLRSMWSLV